MERWRTGPVAVTGATGQVGRALCRRLADLDTEVVPLARGWDPGELAGAEVVVHLAGSLRPRPPDTYRGSNLDTARATATAVGAIRDVAAASGGDTGIRRIVFLSFLAADPDSPNPYLAYKARAERELVATRVPTTVLRAGHVLGPPASPGPLAESLLLGDKDHVTVLGTGRQLLSPVALVDVVEALVHAALDPASPVGTYDLTGPETFTMDRLVRSLNDEDVAIRHLPDWIARLLAGVVPSLPRPLVDVLLSDTASTGDPRVVAEQFGIRLHDFDEVWQATTADRRIAA